MTKVMQLIMITLLSDDEFTTLKNNKKYVKELNLILANNLAGSQKSYFGKHRQKNTNKFTTAVIKVLKLRSTNSKNDVETLTQTRQITYNCCNS